MMKTIGTAVFCLGLLISAFSHGAVAQVPKGVLEACETERETFCREVTPGEGRLFACMYAYEDKLSKGCSKAIDDFADAMDYLFANANEALAVCAPDIEENCSEIAAGGGRILTCLAEKKAEVGKECQEVVEVFSERFGLK